VALLAAVATWACSVPVFRYALERWPADDYHAVVFHRGPLSPEQQAVVTRLSQEGLAGEKFANVETHLVDLDDDPSPEWLGLWLAQGSNALPWMAVMYPPVSSVPVALWTGPLESTPVEQLLDSPARQEIAKRLIQGQSAVWALLEVGDKAKDDAAEKLLQERLAHLQGVLQLPTLEQEDITSGLVSVSQEELQVGFSIVRLSRNDPAEAILARMLLGTEEDLKDLNEPMAFPIFGRGRALYALVGRGINHETIDEACSFLIGACSCQVKELNPGVDLLISADWDHLVQTAFNADRELPALTGLVGFEDKAETEPLVASDEIEALPPVAAAITNEPPSPDPSDSSQGLRFNLMLVGGLGLVVILGGSIFLFRK